MASQEAPAPTAKSGEITRQWKSGPFGKLDWHQGVPKPLVGFTIVALVIYVIIIGWSSFQDPPRIKGKAEIKFDQYVVDLEAKCHGDFSKLSPAEQKKLNGFTMGHGAMLIKQKYLHPNQRLL